MAANESPGIKIEVMGYTFPVNVPDADLTQRAADHINDRMEFYRSKYADLTAGQVAALVALDISEELYREREQNEGFRRSEEAQWTKAQARMNGLLSQLNSLEKELNRI